MPRSFYKRKDRKDLQANTFNTNTYTAKLKPVRRQDNKPKAENESIVPESEERTKGNNPFKFSLEIKPIETAKNKVKQRVLMEKNIIPKHPASVLYCGSSGSGKTTLLANLLTRKIFYKDYFDEIHLFSPTGCSDDIFAQLDLPDENIHMEMSIDELEDIMESQRKSIEKAKGKLHLCKKILIIFEDVQGNARFMRSKPFLKCFIANRHYGISSWLCGQAFNRTPRSCRLQANNLFIFRGSNSEMEIFADEFAPPGIKKREFLKLIDGATKDKYSFLHINMRVPHEERYRKNLDQILSIK